jgi:hypothetical protein
MSQKNVALSRSNWLICGVAVLIIITGFVLMAGPGTTAEYGFEPDIFSVRRIRVAPMVCVAGFLLMVVGILYPAKDKE